MYISCGILCNFAKNIPTLPPFTTVFMKKLLLLAILGAVGFGAQAQITSPYQPPYIQNFDVKTMPDGWKAYDDNKDGKTWSIYFNKVEISEFGKVFDLDDWLVSPGIPLDRTKTYLLEYKPSRIWGVDNLASLEVKMGTDDKYAEMTEIVDPKTEITDYFSPGVRKVIHPIANGVHYFAFHATGTQTSGISFDDFIIREATMPDKVSDIELTMPEQYGDTHVTVSFTAPTTSVGGDKLLGLSKITVYRSGIYITEYKNPRPGERIVLNDNCTYGSGNYQWKITAYDINGEEGLTAESPVTFVGVNAPAQPANLKVVEKEHTGEVTLSWDPVTTDIRGLQMPAEFIDYQLYANGSVLVESGATSPYTFQAVDPDKQDYLTVLVSAKSSYGSGVTVSPTIIVGKMYTSFRESFNNGAVSTNIRYETGTKPADIYVFDNALLGMYTGMYDGDADDTNGCLAVISMYKDYNASVGIGKYDLSEIENPVLKFYTYIPEVQEGCAANLITLYADRGMGYTEVFCYDMSQHPDLKGWQPVTVDLSRFKDQLVSFKLTATIINMPYILIDGLAVRNQCDHNLTARTPYTLESVAIGEPLEVQARVENIGNYEAAGAKIYLLVDGKEVASQDLDPIMPGKSIMATFKHVLSRVCGHEVEISTRVEYENDQDLSDNISDVVITKYLLPNYPAVTDLTGTSDSNQNVELNWSEPSLVITPVRIIESFENGEANAVNVYGDWTFVDVDDLPTLIIDENDRFPFQGAPVGGAIADAVGHYMPYFPLTGNRFLAMCASEDGATNDWAISPLLTGEAQEVTFWARSYDSYGFMREPFNFMISTTGKEIENFTQLGEAIYTYGSWDEYKITIPEGTKYFAINYKVDYGLMLMLDEFSFIPADTGEPLEIKGYNLYRDGELLNAEIIPSNIAYDLNVAPGDHTYHVTTIFNRGESPASNPAEVKVTEGVADAVAGQVKVEGVKGAIVVTSQDATVVTVADVAGRLVDSRMVQGTATVSLPSGIYVVTAGSTKAKVVVL